MALSLQNSCKLIIYISKLLFPNYPGYYFPIYMLIIYNKVNKQKVLLNVLSVPYETMEILLSKTFSLPTFWNDINNTILINKYSGKCTNFVQILSENKSVYRIFYAIESSFVKQGYVGLSNTLKFNIKNEKLNIQPVILKDVLVATELELSLVASPQEFDNTFIDSLVKRYFKTPKIICENDILSIDLQKYEPQIYYNNCKYNIVKRVYFKCIRLSFNLPHKGCGVCVIGETTFKQSSNVQSYVPSIIHYNLNSNINYDESLINHLPWGLEDYAEAIEKSIMPFISNPLKIPVKLRPAFLIEGIRGSGKLHLISSLALKHGLHLYEVINADLSGTSYAQTEAKICQTFFKAKLCAPCFLIINNFENFGRNNEGQYDPRIIGFFKSQLEQLFTNNTFPLILICISHTKKGLPAELRQPFLNIIDIDVPNLQQRASMLRWIIKLQNLAHLSINYDELAGKTHGFVFQDLQALVYHAKSKTWNFDKALDIMQSKYSQSLGAPKIPNIQWSDVGGLGDIEQEIMHTINLPLKYPHLLQGTGLKRSGILLYGPPGTGKTLVAKAVANECKLCFLSVKGPELLNMYVGQSEKNVREVFERAREASPCIIFFDELDALAPNRGVSGDSGGVMDRVVSQLLAEMDGLDQTATIFIIGATNRPDLIDPALLRPGRFDKLLYVGPCIDVDSKLSVLRALTRKFNLDEKVDLKEIVQICPENITGADFYGLCSNAWLSAARSIFEKEEAQQMSHNDVVVCMEDFYIAVKDLKPSINFEDLAYFHNLKTQLSATQ